MFDINKCKKDGWKCEFFHATENQWTIGEFDGYDRFENIRIIYFSNVTKDNQAISFHKDNVRNLQKPKIKRWIEGCKIASLSNEKNNKFISVPMIIIDDRHPLVDHSDAILEKLQELKTYRDVFHNSYQFINLFNHQINEIKKERGE